MIDRQIEMPMPMPLGLVVKEGSKMRSAVAGSSPAPLSVIATLISPGPMVSYVIASTFGWPLTAPIASTPFMIRFKSTCCSCTRSPRISWPLADRRI